MKWLLWIVAAIALAALALQGWIEFGVHQDIQRATSRFPGDRVDALLAQVNCTSCPMKDRNRAVWALGQLKDPRALPELRRHYSGAKCDHERALCQYELQKAIRHLE